MTTLDGNVLAGPLSELEDAEPTARTGRCLGCGDVATLALAVVHVGAGLVARCRACDAVLLTVVQRPGRPPELRVTGVALEG